MFPAVSLLRDEGSHSVSHVEIVNKRVSGHFPRMKHTRAGVSGGKNLRMSVQKCDFLFQYCVFSKKIALNRQNSIKCKPINWLRKGKPAILK